MADKITIGVTQENQSTLSRLIQSNLFQDEMDAAKFAMSLAINSGTTVGNAEGTSTKWNVGSFDSDGEIKAVINALFPESTTPYRTVEYLFNTGLRIIGQAYEEKGNFSLSDLLQLSQH